MCNENDIQGEALGKLIITRTGSVRAIDRRGDLKPVDNSRL